jgi:hypothetical protein
LAIERLDDLRRTERHNVLAALVNQFGTGPIYTALETASALSLMSPDDFCIIREQIARDEHNPLSNLRIPLLTYIPDLAEWRPQGTDDTRLTTTDELFAMDSYLLFTHQPSVR